MTCSALFSETTASSAPNTPTRVTQEAAKLFSKLAERLELEERNLGATREQVAHFLMRLLFCLFADSIGLLPDRIFRKLLHSDDRFNPRRFLRKLTLLFEAMSQPDGIFGEHTIKYFNGGLFDTASIIQLDKADLGILYEVSKNYDWSHIAPAIFGTLFERSLTPPVAPSSEPTTPAKKTSACSSNRYSCALFRSAGQPCDNRFSKLSKSSAPRRPHKAAVRAAFAPTASRKKFSPHGSTS